MELPEIELSYPGEPCDSVRIRAIEEKIGRKLPEDYKTFIMKTGGGTVNLKNTMITGLDLPGREEPEPISVSQIFGNGEANGSGNDLADYCDFLTEEWEIPSEVLLIGTSREAGMHECFVLNYDLDEFPLHAVLLLDNELYIDDEVPQRCTLVAESFTAFLHKLMPEPDYDVTTDIEAEKQKERHDNIRRAREGALSPRLRECIAATQIADYEQIVRRAAYELALTPGDFSVWASNPSWLQLVDVVYWAAQQVHPSASLESFKGPFWEDTPWDGNEYQFPSLVERSFLIEGDCAGIVCSVAMLRIWWDTRMEEGNLLETPDGFKLRDDYIATVIESLRS